MLLLYANVVYTYLANKSNCEGGRRMTFSERLANARKEKGFTQSDVAEKLNVSFQAVSLWERGETTPEIDKLVDIASLYQVSTDWLLTGKTEERVLFDFQDSLSDRLFNEDRMYRYVQIYAEKKGLTQTLKVLPYAKELHDGQFRKGKEKVPYIYHPILMACHALALGLNEDALVAAALLHDVCEDCGVLPEELPVSEETRETVRLLTKDDSPAGKTTEGKEKYFEGIAGNRLAIMIKLLDRCQNVSGMALSFTPKRMARYIRETEEWIYPLFEKAKKSWPEYASQIFLLKYQIVSIVQSLKKQLS